MKQFFRKRFPSLLLTLIMVMTMISVSKRDGNRFLKNCFIKKPPQIKCRWFYKIYHSGKAILNHEQTVNKRIRFG